MKKVLCLLMIKTTLIAGGEVGNGGDAIICFKHKDFRISFEKKIKEDKDPFHSTDIVNKISSIETLDLYEYKLENLFSGIVPDVYNSEGNSRTIVNQIFERVESRTSFYEYLEEAETKLPDRVWKIANGIAEIDDEGYTDTLKKNCTKVQMAKQIDNFIYVNDSIFKHKKMSSLSRATLVLHEYVYNIALSLGYENSSHVRQIVGHLISGSEWDRMTTHELNKVFSNFLDKEDFALSGAYQINNQHLWLESFRKETNKDYYEDMILFYPNGQIKEAISAKNQVFDLGEKEIEITKGEIVLFSIDGKILN